jgi:hypothetical protein
MKRIAYRAIDDLFIVAYGILDPTADEWLRYLDEVGKHGFERTKQLIYTAGGGPNSAQRKLLNDRLDGRQVPVAVMSDSTAIRGVCTALSWFNRAVKAFQPTEFAAALRHLSIPESLAPSIEQEMTSLRAEVEREPRLASA